MLDKGQPGNCQVLEAETPALKNQPQWKNSQGCAMGCGKERTVGKKGDVQSPKKPILFLQLPNQEF